LSEIAAGGTVANGRQIERERERERERGESTQKDRRKEMIFPKKGGERKSKKIG